MNANINMTAAGINFSSFTFCYKVNLVRSNLSGLAIAKTAEGGVIKEGNYGVWAENVLPHTIYRNTVDGWAPRSFDAIMERYFTAVGYPDAKLLRTQKDANGNWCQIADHLADYEGLVIGAQIKFDIEEDYVYNDKGELVDLADISDARSIKVYFNDFNHLRDEDCTVNPKSELKTLNIRFCGEYVVVFSNEVIGDPMGLADLDPGVEPAKKSRFRPGHVGVKKDIFAKALQETALRKQAAKAQAEAEQSEAKEGTELKEKVNGVSSMLPRTGGFMKKPNLDQDLTL